MSAANPPSQSHNHESETPAPASEPRPTEPLGSPAPLREALESQFSLEVEGFDFHDTIPAPPWLDEPPDTIEAPLVPPP
jgi:hypothetical protein